MIRRLVDFSLDNRFLVLAAAFLLLCWGAISFHQLPVEAYPDVANNYVEIITQWRRRSRGPAPGLFRDCHHHHGILADLHPATCRGAPVPSDGLDCGLCAPWSARFLDADCAGALQHTV